MSDSASNDIEKRPFVELAQFVLNRNTENVREELHDYLVEIALFNTPHGATRDEIKSAIEKEFGFSEFPIPIVDSALYRLGKKLKIQGSPPRYYISDDRRKALGEKFQNQGMLRDHFAARVLTKIEKDYGEISDVASDNIIKCLFKFLAAVFDNLSINLARLISKSPEEVKEVSELLETNEMLEKSFEPIEDKILIKDSIRAVKDILTEYEEKTSLFLYSLAQSYVLLKILNIDPECQTLQKKLILDDMIVFLDTNIAINLLCEKALPTIHEYCVRIINLMNLLSIKSVISMRTAKEVERHLQFSDEEYQNIGDVPEDRREKLLRFATDEIIREYWIQLRINPGLKWTAFIGRLRNFPTILKKKYSIEIDKKVYDDIYSDPHFGELSKLIEEAAPDKPTELIDHDCFHLVLIAHLRNEIGDGEIIPKRWFLTRDKTLSLVEKIRIVTEKKRPTSVLIDVWLHMISPLLSPKIATEQASEIFSRCFSSDLVPSFPIIKPVLLTKLVGPCLDRTDLDINEIKEIVGDIYLREHLEEMNQPKVEAYLTKKLIDIREKRHQREMQQSEEEKRALAQKVASLEEEKKKILEEYDTEKHLGRYLAGGIIFLVVWITTYIFILLPTIKNPPIACSFSILVSLIFGYLLGFKRYEWILERFSDLVGAIRKT
jgi:hypothetical protein